MLRDDAPTCPVCSERALDQINTRWKCAGCGGVLVPEPELLALAAEAKKHGITDAPLEKLEYGTPKTPEPFRTCPRCVAQMTKHDLYGITVDKCDAHGVWFDGEELARVIEKYSLAGLPKVALWKKIVAYGTMAAAIGGDVAIIVLAVIG